MKVTLTTFKKTLQKWYGNDPFSQSAAISYYTIFSFPALAFIYLSLASLFARKEVVQAQLTNYIAQIVGPSKTQNIEAIIEQTAPAYTNVWALLVGGGLLLFAALRLFLQLQTALNFIWEVREARNVSIWKIIRQRIAAFGVMLGILFILLVTLFITTLLTSLGEYIANNISEELLIGVALFNFMISLVIISVLFTILLKMLPDAEIGLRYAFAGGTFTAIFFIFGQYLIGLYFDLAEPASAYGVTASVILLMLWVSYACLILLLGAEFTKILQEENNGEKAKATQLGAKLKRKKIV